MARITVEDCLEQVENRFALVLLATKRARQLLKGAPALVEHPKNKAPVLALREIAAQKVRFDKDVREIMGTNPLDLKARYGDPRKRLEALQPSTHHAPAMIAPPPLPPANTNVPLT